MSVNSAASSKGGVGSPPVPAQNLAVPSAPQPAVLIKEPITPGFAAPQPRQTILVSCKTCDSKYMTSEYSVIKCTDCERYICLLDDCFRTYKTTTSMSTHQKSHRKRANLNQCYTCKAPKNRDSKEVASFCNVCGTASCLIGDCTFETALPHSLSRHQISSVHRDKF